MKEIRLFDYQQEMLENITEVFSAAVFDTVLYNEKGKRVNVGSSVMVQMPTGTGKTYVMAAVVRWFLETYSKGEVWLIAHRKELVEQMEQTLDRFVLEYGEKNEELKAKVRIRVLSIQWLTRNIGDLDFRPGLIIVDEAHHSLATSYQDVFIRNHKALKIGMTATPCRMKQASFGTLFSRLITSPSTRDFIMRGYLASYNYVAIGMKSTDQQIINQLKGRGSDGDYSIKEMDEKLNIPPAIRRLYNSVMKYAAGKKGIVYAIDIDHAKAIAECYNALGIKAVALDSKTAAKTRKKAVGAFREGELDCLVNVNLFDEGFDCPDVEYIQMARPTLSLAKYLQMVGRGLRVARRKSYCVILDNVGLYRRFGMPSADRDWQQMFEGRSQLADSLQEICMRINNSFCHWGSVVSENEEMMKILGHDRQKKMIEDNENDEIVEDKDGWIDRRSGLRFAKRPQTVRLLGVEFCTEDGMRFFPRIRSKFIDDKAYINLKSLELQVGRGINWKRKYISMDEPDKVYQLKDKAGSVRLYVDDEENCYAQGNPDMELTPIETQVEMNDYCLKYSRKEKKAAEKHQKIYKHGLFYPIHNSKVWERDEVQKGVDEIWYVPKDVFGESYWVDGISGLKHYAKPVAEQRGFVRLLRERLVFCSEYPGFARYRIEKLADCG